MLVRGVTAPLDGGAPSFQMGPDTRCKEGPYVGHFLGFFDPALMNDALMGGEIAFSLESALSREFLQITSSLVEGVANDSIKFRFRVAGQSGCESGEFDAEMVEGVWTINETERAFHGKISGEYDLEKQRFDGTWWIADSALGGPLLSGDWFARFDRRADPP